MKTGLAALLALGCIGLALLSWRSQFGSARDGNDSGSAGPEEQRRGRGMRGEDVAGNGWITSLAEGKLQARKSGKPLMVVMRCAP